MENLALVIMHNVTAVRKESKKGLNPRIQEVE